MARIECRLIANSNGKSVRQIYAGLLMLHRNGLIKLRQSLDTARPVNGKQPRQRGVLGPAGARVVLNGRVRVLYDMFDGPASTDREALRESDFCFKRSYAPERLYVLGEDGRKVFPFGLNYEVEPSCWDPFAVRRALTLERGKQKIIEAVRSANLLGERMFVPRLHTMWSPPDFNAPPRILFMVRAWSPDEGPSAPEYVQDRQVLNERRADCIEQLRKAFGRRFYGGFIPHDYARKVFPSLLLPKGVPTTKRGYIERLRRYPICIATTGLHGSIGYKFAEYIAFSKAVLSEPLNYQVPGKLHRGTHYLEFETPEQCVERAAELMDNRTLRQWIMVNNARHYQSYMRADTLIMHTFAIALGDPELQRQLAGRRTVVPVRVTH